MISHCFAQRYFALQLIEEMFEDNHVVLRLLRFRSLKNRGEFMIGFVF